MKLINKLQRLHVNVVCIVCHSLRAAERQIQRSTTDQKETKLARKPFFFILQSLQSLTKRQSLNNLSFLQNFPNQCKITLIKSPNEGQRGLSKLDKNSEGCIFYYIHVLSRANQGQYNTTKNWRKLHFSLLRHQQAYPPSLPTQKSWQLKESSTHRHRASFTIFATSMNFYLKAASNTGCTDFQLRSGKTRERVSLVTHKLFDRSAVKLSKGFLKNLLIWNSLVSAPHANCSSLIPQ